MCGEGAGCAPIPLGLGPRWVVRRVGCWACPDSHVGRAARVVWGVGVLGVPGFPTVAGLRGLCGELGCWASPEFPLSTKAKESRRYAG